MTEHIFREVHYGYTDGTALGRTLEKQEEIVRCRDCRFYDERHRECSMLECQECWYKLHDVEPDGFCWRGERKVDA